MWPMFRRKLKLEDGARQSLNVNEFKENLGLGEQETGGEQEDQIGAEGRVGRNR